MSSQRRKSENVRKKVTKSDDMLLSGLSLNVAQMDINQKTLEKCKDLTAADLTETVLLQSRQVKAQLEKQLDSCQKEVVQKQQRVELVEKRFLDLDANSRAIIVFMEEYKHQNAQLKLENKRLQTENDTLFSQKLHDKELTIKKMKKEIKALTDAFSTKESTYKEKMAQSESTSLKKLKEHKEMEASLLEKLNKSQQQHELTDQLWRAVKLKLLKAEEQHALREATMNKTITSLTKERDKLLRTSVEQEHTIQEKTEELRLLDLQCKEQRRSQAKAEERFKQEVQAVNTDTRVKSLNLALEEAGRKYEQLKKDFKAFREHSCNLLTKERELNKILRHLRN
ncbi:coiled-coil domain-containing protein 89 isoform X2 [Festucalex cinctus]